MKKDKISNKYKSSKFKENLYYSFSNIYVDALLGTMVLLTVLLAVAPSKEKGKVENNSGNSKSVEYTLTPEELQSSSLNDDKIDLFNYEKHIAYHTQKSGIDMDGVINNPRYFASLPYDYRNIIVLVKDLRKDKLENYLNMLITPEEAVSFDKELVERMKDEDVKKYSFENMLKFEDYRIMETVKEANNQR
ncbi:MAG: hypothetical protein ACI4N3_01985 [Alphaproteobacteria bacterium]